MKYANFSSSISLSGPVVGGCRSGVSFIIPAHNESKTVEGVIDATFQAGTLLQLPFEVIVVADACRDNTAQVAADRGATTVVRRARAGSKALAMKAGVLRSSGDYLFFVDADCLHLTGSTLASIGNLVLDEKAAMAVGTFDYRFGGRLVQRMPWSTGQRVIHRNFFDISDERYDRYNAELLINEAVGRSGGRTASVIMRGVHQRTKRDKHGVFSGYRETAAMWMGIARIASTIDATSYRDYMREVHLLQGEQLLAQSRAITDAGYYALKVTAKLLH